jgi:UDP-2,3-diacylglucosamine pyrophosphatase LpxH
MSKDKKKYKSIFISDVHLGTKHCSAEKLLQFLKETEADRYYLVGDIIDGWMMRNKIYWPQAHNNIIQFFLKQSKKSVEVIYVIGNHDEFLREYSGTTMGNIKLVDEIIHNCVDGKRYLVVHGDQFDLVTMNAKWLALIGGWLYDRMIDLNRYAQWICNALGIKGFSLSAWAKSNVKEAVNFIGDYENVVADAAKRKLADGVICGHIHHANISNINDVVYMNCGDWVESCTALVENYDGSFEVIRK